MIELLGNSLWPHWLRPFWLLLLPLLGMLLWAPLHFALDALRRLHAFGEAKVRAVLAYNGAHQSSAPISTT